METKQSLGMAQSFKATKNKTKTKSTHLFLKKHRKRRRLLRPKKLQKRNRRESTKNLIRTWSKQITNWLATLKTQTFMETMRMPVQTTRKILVAKTLRRDYNSTLAQQIERNPKRR